MAHLQPHTRLSLALLAVLSSTCDATPDAAAPRAPTGKDTLTEPCPARRRASLPLPGVSREQATLAYWLGRFTPKQLDEPLLATEDITLYNTNIGRRPGRDVVSQRDLSVPIDAITLASDVHARLAQLRSDATSLALADGSPAAEAARQAFSQPLPPLTPSLHTIQTGVTLRCGPFDAGLYKLPVDPAYDKNACGSLQPGETIERLAEYPGGLWLVRSRFSLGWMSAKVGVSDAKAPQLPTPRTLTRRALLEKAFSFIDAPYGLGDANGGNDCSGLLLRVFDAFGLAVPRHSGWQAEAGQYAVELSGLPDAAKLERMERATAHGVVLVHFPGHIMLYLGRDAAGVPMVLHALGEHAQPCEGGGETIVDVQRVVVSTLELGRGSSRRSLIERATRLVVFGRDVPSELQSALAARDAPPTRPEASAVCADTSDTRIFVSPATPMAAGTVRFMATTMTSLDGVYLRVWNERGEAPRMDELRLGGPPFTRVARLREAEPGTYTVVLGNADKVLACKRIRVRKDPLAPREPPSDPPLWEPRWQWERDTENLWAAFVERLFDGTADDETTWTNLHTLLQDPNRNLLHDHLGLQEDEALVVEPDCADLPYALRAYFAWKLRLPYAFRPCARGREGRPPSCGEMRTTLDPRVEPDEVAAFGQFINRTVRSGVHSGTGRTHPEDSATDLYPVALDRAALTPGTVYADPYGHVMMISKWFPQGSIPGSPYGVLMAAEAQPDGTVGRRRFWQGSFLFEPNTRSVGSGWKHLRPLVYDKATRTLSALDNAALTKHPVFAPFSLQQYEGTREDFYDRMDALINPKPLAPEERIKSLVDSLDEGAKRRVLAIDNGEAYVREHPGQTIPMPRGAEIFETQGPWEDYATPSRDMRLLIAIDTVLDLPARIERTPERFTLPDGTTPKHAADAARTVLDSALRARSFSYTRSDGSAHTLTLADVVARRAALELGYNPNTCPEARWGAPEGSPERSTCVRTTPTEQFDRMSQYRSWFATRTRPPRDN